MKAFFARWTTGEHNWISREEVHKIVIIAADEEAARARLQELMHGNNEPPDFFEITTPWVFCVE